MLQVLLSVEIIIALALVGTILLQQSEGGALGMGGGPGGGGGAGFGGFMSARGAANLLTRATSILAFLFISIALSLAVFSGQRTDGSSVFDDVTDVETPFTQENLGDDFDALSGTDDEFPAIDEPPAASEDEEGGGE